MKISSLKLTSVMIGVTVLLCLLFSFWVQLTIYEPFYFKVLWTLMILAQVAFTYSSILVIRYYFKKKHRAPAIVSIIDITLNNVLMITYLIVIFIYHSDQIEDLMLMWGIIYMSLNLIYGLSLLLSKARKEFWLKIFGIALITVATGSAIDFLLNNPNTETKFSYILMFASNIIPVCLMLNIRQDIKNFPKENAELIDN